MPLDHDNLDFGPIYNDGTYKYFGEAAPGTALDAKQWRVSRMVIATSQIQYAGGDDTFNNLFTDLAAAQALFT